MVKLACELHLFSFLKGKDAKNKEIEKKRQNYSFLLLNYMLSLNVTSLIGNEGELIVVQVRVGLGS